MHLAHILRLRNLASHRSQVAIQGAAEELEQHLEADAGESWVVSSPKLVGDPLVSIPWFVRSAGRARIEFLLLPHDLL